MYIFKFIRDSDFNRIVDGIKEDFIELRQWQVKNASRYSRLDEYRMILICSKRKQKVRKVKLSIFSGEVNIIKSGGEMILCT